MDDGSSDDSVKIIDALSLANGFYFSAHENIGLPGTLNRALEVVRGKYVIIIASDDYMMLDRVEKQVSFMEQHPEVGACGGSFLAIDDDGNLKSRQKIRTDELLDFDDLFWRKRGGPPAPTAMIRTRVITEVGGYKLDVHVEDLYMWLRITNLGYKVAVVSDILGYYRKHERGSHVNHEWLVDNVLKVYDDYSDHPKYKYVVAQFLASIFVKAATKEKAQAVAIARKVSWRLAPRKMLKGILRLATKW